MAQWARVLGGQAWGSKFKSPAPMYKAKQNFVYNPDITWRGNRRIPGASCQSKFWFSETLSQGNQAVLDTTGHLTSFSNTWVYVYVYSVCAHTHCSCIQTLKIITDIKMNLSHDWGYTKRIKGTQRLCMTRWPAITESLKKSKAPQTDRNFYWWPFVPRTFDILFISLQLATWVASVSQVL